jgi:hypothetical protein
MAEKAVRVFVGASLPRAVWIAEVLGNAGVDTELDVAG